MIVGWIERNEGDKFFGWLSSSDNLADKHKAVHIYSSGELRWIKRIIIKPAERSDLEAYSNVCLFEFDFGSQEFNEGVSTCAIHFKISCLDTAYPLLVTSHLVSQSVAAIGGPSEGMAFGRISSDGAAVIGAGGKIFLREGSNNVENLYNGDFSINLAGWLNVFQSRHALSAQQNFRYIQIVIPEKSSVMYWNVPFHATKGSAGLNELVKCLDAHPELRGNFISGEDYLPDEVHSEAVFRAFDTHMSTAGCKLLVDTLVERIAPEIDPFYRLGPFTHGSAPGDIGSRFLEDGDITERPPLYESLLSLDGEVLAPALISEYDPSEGNIGIQRSWRCANAPFKKRVVCFGGSSFERGEVSSTLSWWCSRLFAEFHFYWDPECRADIVASQSPDIVICQTIERFLTIVPTR